MIRKIRNDREKERLRRTATGAVVLFALLLALIAGTAGTAAAQTGINACGQYGLGSDTFELTQDIDTTSGGICIDIVANDVVIDGNGHTVNGSADSGSVGINAQPVFGSSISNVTVKNVTVTNFETGVAFNAADGTVEDVNVASTATGVAVTGSSDFTLEDSTVSETETGVAVRSSTDVTVRDNLVVSGFLFQIPDLPEFPDYPDLPDLPDDPEFPDIPDGDIPDFEPLTTPNNNGDAGIALGAQNSVVENNIVRDFDSYGIFLFGASNNDVENNLVLNNTEDGIYLVSSTSNSLTGNIVDENDRYGIWLADASNSNTLTDNLAEDNTEAGIYLGGTAAFADDNTLVNNTVRDSEYGIWIRNSIDNEVSKSLVENNHEGIVVEDGPTLVSNEVRTEDIESAGNTFTDDVSRNNDLDFVVNTFDFSPGPPYPLSNGGSSHPVTNLNIGASTEADTTLSFNADDVLIRSVETPESDPGDASSIGRYFNATGLSASSFLNVSLSYENTDVDSVNESTLELRRYDGTGWVSVSGSSVDTNNNVVSADIDSFSEFGAFGEADDDDGGNGDGGNGGPLSANNPFGDSSNNPVSRSTVISRVVEWNLNDTINGTAYTRNEIINFVVEWNLAT